MPKPLTFRLVCCFALISSSANWSIAAPVGNNTNIVSGTGNISALGNTTTIDQTSQNIAIDWDSFNINSGETVNFVQPNINSIALNRDFSGSASQIFGNLNANGHVFLLNTAGILMDSGASINVGSLLISDMAISNSTAQNFGNGSNAGTIAFSDEDLDAGGITVMGSIATNGPHGVTTLSQYVRIGGDVVTNNGDITFKVGGSAVLITDPDGLYGIQLVDPVSKDISGNSELYGYVDTPLLIAATNGDIYRHVKYQSDLEIVAVANEPSSGNVTIQTIAGTIHNPVIDVIAPPLTVSPTEENDLENTITDSLSEESTDEISELSSDVTSPEKSSLDSIMDDCVPQDPSDKDCLKQNAIKRYLGKLLIGGSLPD